MLLPFVIQKRREYGNEKRARCAFFLKRIKETMMRAFSWSVEHSENKYFSKIREMQWQISFSSVFSKESAK